MILPIDKALVLYKMLAPYIPDDIEDEFELSMQMVISIRESENKGVYADAVSMMSGINLYSLVDHSAEDILNMFIEGMKENRIVYLKRFAEQVGLS
jgi:hypothetical protein